MATNRQKLFISFYIIRASLFGIGYSRIFSLAESDAWISAILGTLFGVIIVFLIKTIMNKKSTLTLADYLKENTLIKIAIIALCLYFILEELTTLTNFMTSFYLLNTPNYIISLCSIIICLYVISKGIHSILKTSEIFFYLSILISVITLIILSTYVDISHFRPILLISNNSLIKSTSIYALYTTVPLITLLNLKNDGKDLIKLYLFSSLLLIILIIIITGIFGPEFVQILRFPEYIILKRIKILSFIEKIESLLSITYILDNLFLTIMSLYTIITLINNKIISLISILFIYLFTSYFINGNYINALNNYYLSPYIFILGLLIIIILAIKKKPKLQIQRDT